MEFSQRDLLLGIGIGAVFSARHFYREKRLWPFRVSVIVAWPSLGVAIMQTVISNTTTANIQMLQESEEVEKTRQANAAFLMRMKNMAEKR